MNILLRHLEANSVSALKCRSASQFLPCIHCSHERKSRNFSTLKGPGSQRLFQRDEQQFIQYSPVRHDHDFSIAHAIVSGAQGYFEYVHAATGLDWWASLIIAVYPIRIALTLIISRLQNRNMKKVVTAHIHAMPEVRQLKPTDITPERLMRIVSKHKAKSPEEQRKLEEQIKVEVERQYSLRRCHPFKNFGYGLMSMPVWISGALAMRNMTGSDMLPFLATYKPVAGMSDEGCLWFTNFLLPDCYHVLPCLEFVIVQLTFEISLSLLGNDRSGWIKFYVYFIRFWQCWVTWFVWVLWNKPSGLLFYWVLTTSANLGTILLLQHPRVRTTLGLHQMSKTPYRDIAKNTVARYNIRQRLRDRKLRKREARKLKEELKKASQS